MTVFAANAVRFTLCVRQWVFGLWNAYRCDPESAWGFESRSSDQGLAFNLRFCIFYFSLAAVSAVVLLSRIPLGVPGEWVWDRHALFDGPVEALIRLTPAISVAIGYLGFAVWGTRKVETASRGRKLLLGAALLGMSYTWLTAVQMSAPVVQRELKPYWVLYSPSSAGYFFESTFRMVSPSAFLETYEARMQEGEVLHVGTHPPGLFLLSHYCVQFCKRSPVLTKILAQFPGLPAASAFRTLEADARLARPLSEAEMGGLQLLSLLSTLAVVFTSIPLAFIFRQYFTARVTWQVLCLWPMLPALAVFLPKSDLLFTLTGTTVVALMVGALPAEFRWWRPALAGVVLFGGMLMSLAHLPVVFLLTVYGAILFRDGGFLQRKCIVMSCCIMMAAFAVAATCWSLVTHCHIARVWMLNLRNHEAFYSEYSRTWWRWLLVNPIELAFSIGLPVAVTVAQGAFLAFSQSKEKPDVSRNASWLCVAAAVTWLALWISGKNQGEAARLWCFLLPWLLINTGLIFSRMDPKKAMIRWTALMASQLIAALVTVSVVNGFDF